jgi:hypothetical protein
VVPYQRRKGRSCADLSFVLRSNRQSPVGSLANAIPIARNVMETAKTGASNQRAWWTLFSMGSSRELTASNHCGRSQFRVAGCPAYYAKAGET